MKIRSAMIIREEKVDSCLAGRVVGRGGVREKVADKPGFGFTCMCWSDGSLFLSVRCLAISFAVSVYPSIRLSVWLSVRPSVCLHTHTDFGCLLASVLARVGVASDSFNGCRPVDANAHRGRYAAVA